MRRLWAAVIVLLAAAGSTPSTGPTTGPTTGPAPPIGHWFDQLADADPAVRDAARGHLAGLPADQLPALLAVVRAAAPVRPEQAAVLREVVRQAFLAGQSYDVDPSEGPKFILGQGWPGGGWAMGERVGVPVVNRWPGFPSRQLLRDGDLILGLYADPDAPASSPPDLPTHTVDQLVRAMRVCPGVPRVAMSVLRDGRPIRVAGTMVAEPVQTINRRAAATAAFLLDRQRRADDYWDAHFAPVVDAADDPAVPDPLDGTAR